MLSNLMRDAFARLRRNGPGDVDMRPFSFATVAQRSRRMEGRELFDYFEWELVKKDKDGGDHLTKVTILPELDEARAVVVQFSCVFKSTPGRTWSDLCKVPLSRRRYKNEDPEEAL